MAEIDTNTPEGAQIARDHAIARLANLAHSILLRVEPLIDAAIVEATKERPTVLNPPPPRGGR